MVEMYWRTMNWLFGWHFIIIPWGFSETSIRRVRTLKATGQKYAIHFGEYYFLNENGRCADGRRYTPLTWSISDEEKKSS